MKPLTLIVAALALGGTAQAQPAPPPPAGGASNFTGKATLVAPMRAEKPSKLNAGTVVFEPGARTNWHIHPLGQLLVVTAGRGWLQIEGEPARALKPGDVAWTPPGKKHWHGAARTSELSHVAVTEREEGDEVKWLEPVSEAQYPRD
jgi:4-carboxymuconolactone decarboxylase